MYSRGEKWQTPSKVYTTWKLLAKPQNPAPRFCTFVSTESHTNDYQENLVDRDIRCKTIWKILEAWNIKMAELWTQLIILLLESEMNTLLNRYMHAWVTRVIINFVVTSHRPSCLAEQRKWRSRCTLWEWSSKVFLMQTFSTFSAFRERSQTDSVLFPSQTTVPYNISNAKWWNNCSLFHQDGLGVGAGGEVDGR